MELLNQTIQGDGRKTARLECDFVHHALFRSPNGQFVLDSIKNALEVSNRLIEDLVNFPFQKNIAMSLDDVLKVHLSNRSQGLLHHRAIAPEDVGEWHNRIARKQYLVTFPDAPRVLDHLPLHQRDQRG